MSYKIKKTKNDEFLVMDKQSYSEHNRPVDIKERSFDFAIRVVDYVLSFPKNRPLEGMSDQLLRAGTSVGANIEEATGGISRKDFISF